MGVNSKGCVDASTVVVDDVDTGQGTEGLHSTSENKTTTPGGLGEN